ncbi:PREDICTED: forkhead-associated domain-containing protein 1-like isoform X1 [Branchiostoma belcheri]|uniref:Forkhead-associated domain-containing protein 1-like isoform X1 n=2 Tax=Branchiostoma belcheri TaxID=7741 RepID=A0A6P4ZKL2_BRABE|nr:PREDICTED: forkhead-associated domain-containing protein 1-like isoform X1 [Branchiostoma belcheri]
MNPMKGFLKTPNGVFALTKEPMTVGKGQGCEITLKNPHVEDHHAVIQLNERDHCFVLQDLNSQRGTYVNDCRVPTGAVRLAPGDVIKFAGEGEGYELEVYYPPVYQRPASNLPIAISTSATSSQPWAVKTQPKPSAPRILSRRPGHSSPPHDRNSSPKPPQQAAAFGRRPAPPGPGTDALPPGMQFTTVEPLGAGRTMSETLSVSRQSLPSQSMLPNLGGPVVHSTPYRTDLNQSWPSNRSNTPNQPYVVGNQGSSRMERYRPQSPDRTMLHPGPQAWARPQSSTTQSSGIGSGSHSPSVSPPTHKPTTAPAEWMTNGAIRPGGPSVSPRNGSLSSNESLNSSPNSSPRDDTTSHRDLAAKRIGQAGSENSGLVRDRAQDAMQKKFTPPRVKTAVGGRKVGITDRRRYSQDILGSGDTGVSFLGELTEEMNGHVSVSQDALNFTGRDVDQQNGLDSTRNGHVPFEDGFEASPASPRFGQSSVEVSSKAMGEEEDGGLTLNGSVTHGSLDTGRRLFNGEVLKARTLEEKDQYIAELEENMSRMQLLEEDSRDKDNTILSLTEEIAQLEGALLQAQGSGDSESFIAERLFILESEVARKNNELARLRHQLGSMQADSSVYHDSYEAMRSELVERNQEVSTLRADLERTSKNYNMSAGTVMSLRREVTRKDEQIAKLKKEMDKVKKELREREAEVELMSTKFSRLREDKKKSSADDSFSLEKEIINLKNTLKTVEEKAAEQERQLKKYRVDMVRLRMQRAADKEVHTRLQSELNENKSLALSSQHTEQQLRVELESTSSRVERLRSKIIQAVYGAPAKANKKKPSSLLSDNDVLTNLQRLMDERVACQDILKRVKEKGKLDEATKKEMTLMLKDQLGPPTSAKGNKGK